MADLKNEVKLGSANPNFVNVFSRTSQFSPHASIEETIVPLYIRLYLISIDISSS